MSEKIEQLKSAILAGQVPLMVLNTISYALDQRASDIHIQPGETNVRIRFRIDGVLRFIVEFPKNMHPAVVSRIKIMSNLKIDEQRIPQDGRSEVTTKDGREMDLRISTLPTVNGEKVVMRIQDKSREIPTLNQLGLRGNSLNFLKQGLKDPNGIILTSGPTGSGKTTTLYSCLSILNKPDVNILTIEDPVEIQMDGLSQSQVHQEIDYNFATGLRAALRQDPDIMMVGEIRDRETVDVAIESALTGHLVLSTIHTNSATETLTRILNMEVAPFLLASTINTIIAQRLVRKLCDSCKQSVPFTELEKNDPELATQVLHAYDAIADSEKAHYKDLPSRPVMHYMPKGCAECDNIGFKGRIGLYEVMDMNNALRDAILKEESNLVIEELAKEQGMVTIEQSGVIKALLGETALAEVYRVARRSANEASTQLHIDETEPVIPAAPIPEQVKPQPVQEVVAAPVPVVAEPVIRQNLIPAPVQTPVISQAIPSTMGVVPPHIANGNGQVPQNPVN